MFTTYTVIYSKGETLTDGKNYFYQTKNRKEYIQVLEALKGLGYTILHETPVRKEK